MTQVTRRDFVTTAAATTAAVTIVPRHVLGRGFTAPSDRLNIAGIGVGGQGTASTPFEYAAKLTEVMLLGVVALKAGEKIHYDGANMKITNSREANDLLKREYRRGWSL